MTLFRDLLIEKKRRKYYCEVEYLASDGNQYIDTGFVMESGKVMTFNGNMMWTQSQGNANFFYGYRSVNTNEYRGDMRTFFIYGASPAGRLAIRYGVNADNSTNVAVSLNTKFNIAFDGDNLKVDGTTYATLTQAYTPADYKSMWLFNCNTTGYYSADVNHFIGRIYNWQIWSGGILVRDLIPVLDWSYVPCMYDKVSGKLFYNLGTGSFTYGREIHYVDYLESTGTQYIDTGVYLTNNYTVEVDYQLTVASQSRKGLYGGLVTNGARHGALTSPSNQHLEAGYGSTNVYYQLGLPDTNRHVLKQEKNKLYFDGDLVYTFETATFTQNFTAPLGNFNYTNYEPLSAKYYASKWWDGDTLVRDYKPAIDENGVCFMFDRVQHICYLNAGSDVFKYPIKEFEYLENTSGDYANTGGGMSTNVGSYIDTGIKPKPSGRVKIGIKFNDWESNTPYQALFGGYDSNTKNFGVVVWMGQDEHTTYFLDGTQNGQAIFNYEPETYYNFEYNASTKTLTINGTDYVFSSVTALSTQSNLNIYLFTDNSIGSTMTAYNTTYTLKGKIYYFQYYEGDTLVADFIPVFKNGVAGMLNKVNDVFYTNAGIGSFSVGKIFESKYE